MPFSAFELDPRCMRILHEAGITTPTPIQAQAIPIALTGRDLVGVAQTGTGKTLAFALPSLTRLATGAVEVYKEIIDKRSVPTAFLDGNTD